MKKLQKLVALLLLCAVTLLYAACGSSKSAQTAPGEYNADYSATAESYAMDGNAAADTTETAGAEGSGGADSTLAEQLSQQSGRKIIYDSTLSMEALDFDATVKALGEAISAANGYVQQTSLENGEYENAARHATYVYRVPVEKYSQFLNALGEAGTVLSQSESAQDITAQYVDVEARIKSLQMQEERLLTMMAQAGDLETLLAIQNQLTEVQYNIESYTAQRRTYDDLVAYSTVTVYLDEVRRITPRVEDAFGSRIASAFKESWSDFGDGCQNFAVWFVGAIPTLLVLALLAFMILCIVKAARKADAKRRAKLPPVPTGYAPAAYAPVPSQPIQQMVQQPEPPQSHN